MATKDNTLQPFKNQRTDDFASVYANSVMFENNVWDLRMVFGELDQASHSVEQHTAVTMAWSLAKLVMYHLRLQIASYEIVHGKIKIAPDLMPPEIIPPPEQFKSEELFQRAYEAMKQVREDFMKNA